MSENKLLALHVENNESWHISSIKNIITKKFKSQSNLDNDYIFIP